LSTSFIIEIEYVVTTGSTVNECAKVLVKEGIEVHSLTLAR
jgi:predicted amidophosphoribosyltransferase